MFAPLTSRVVPAGAVEPNCGGVANFPIGSSLKARIILAASVQAAFLSAVENFLTLLDINKENLQKQLKQFSSLKSNSKEHISDTFPSKGLYLVCRGDSSFEMLE